MNKQRMNLVVVIRVLATFVFLNFTVTAAAQESGAKSQAASSPSAPQAARTGNAASPDIAPVGGSGRTNFIPIWTNSTTLGDSFLFQFNGEVGLGTTTPAAKLDVETPGKLSAAAILGESTATTGTAYGVEGMVSSSASFPNEVDGVIGISTATSGNTAGVVGNDSNPNGAGIYGQSFAATGGRGIQGFAFSGNGTAVRGDVTGTAMTTSYGIEGVANGPLDSAVIGITTDTTGSAAAVFGQAASAGGTAGVFDNSAAGNLVIGQVSGVHKFRVDGAGKGYFDGGTQTGGADFAESVAVRGSRARYEPGDLLAIDPAGERRLALAEGPYSTEVAGIYSTKPGMLATTHPMDDSGLAAEIPLAVVGIVPCKVTAQNGAIAPGDLLVSSSRAGYAMRGTDRGRMLGAVVGKALEPLRDGDGVIQVLVTLQ